MSDNWREVDSEKLAALLVEKLVQDLPEVDAIPEEAAAVGDGVLPEPAPLSTWSANVPWKETSERNPEEQAEIARLEEEARAQLAADPLRRQAVLEAVLFAAAYPVQIDDLVRVCGWPVDVLENDLDALEAALECRGVRLQRLAGGCRLVTAAEFSYWVEKYLQMHNKVRLTRPQMETLAIVAYNQPVTRAIVDTYRGVHSERVLGQLEDLHLIREVGRAHVPGRPILLGTTDEFLRYFALNSLDELPQLFADKLEEEPDDADIASTIPSLAEDSDSDGALGAPSDGLQKLLAKMRRKREREAKCGVSEVSRAVAEPPEGSDSEVSRAVAALPEGPDSEASRAVAALPEGPDSEASRAVAALPEGPDSEASRAVTEPPEGSAAEVSSAVAGLPEGPAAEVSSAVAEPPEGSDAEA